VAAFVADGLARRSFETSFIDEHWGWQTHAKNPDGTVIEISISHNPDADPGSEDELALMLRAPQGEDARLPLALPRDRGVDPAAGAALEDVFGDANIALGRVDD